MKKIVTEMEMLRRERGLIQVSTDGKVLELPKGNPNTKVSGFYWLYTSYNEADLKSCTPAIKSGAIPIDQLTQDHSGLTNLCSISIDGFWLVYNGIGGVGPKNAGGLRKRILEEFNGGEGTGSLAIRHSSINDLSRWRFSYVLASEITSIANKIWERKIAERREWAWRIEYGWPILCQK